MQNYLAIDLGAESGRTIAGTLEGDRLKLIETHRFANEPVGVNGHLYWDVLRLWSEIKTGIALSIRKMTRLSSLGVDTWGVDFALLDQQGELLANPTHYRDARTQGMLAEAFERIPAEQLFASTGTQFMQINTLFQLLAVKKRSPEVLDAASRLLTIPDLFNFWLSGEICNEFTSATTTQCYDPRAGDWAFEVLQTMQIPSRLFGKISQPGTPLGTLTDQVGAETGAGRVPLILPACHDTGSAVAAVPAAGSDFAWISSGTWSIMGAEVTQPHLDEKTRLYNFTNEGGAGGTWRLSKNIMGLWLIQQCRSEWGREGQMLSYAELTHLAEDASPFLAVIDVDDESFLAAGDMAGRIQAFCARSGQFVPQTTGQILRIVLEGMALKYRLVLERLEEISDKRFETIHIIGGGSQNELLNQFTADATGCEVIAGPVEATAIGNILVQAIGLKHLASLTEARQVVERSFEKTVYQPHQTMAWQEAYSLLRKVIN